MTDQWRSLFERTGVFLVVILASSLVSSAQPQATPGAPYSLDASRLIGSGGYNTPVRRVRPGSYGNLYITGNVTGGKSFRGFVPYTHTSQLRTGLGTGTLSNFRRDSIGLGQIGLRRPVGRAQVYFNPSSTILPLTAQRSALAVPGSAMPRRPILSEAPSNIALPRLSDQEKRMLALPALPVGIRPRDILVVSPTESLRFDFTRLPGSVPPKEQEVVEAPLPPEITLIKPPEMAPSPQVPAKAEERFSELLFLADRAAELRDFRVSAEGKLAFEEFAGRLAREAKPTATQTARPLQRPQRAGIKSEIITTLAGAGSSPFARAMRSAHELLSQRKFYQGLDQYRRARTLRPQDPLPRLGEVNALIAAGEFRSAAGVVEQVIDSFPQLLYLNFDGSTLLGSKAILDLRRDRIGELVAGSKSKDKALLVLGGYVELLAGNRAKATELFEKAGVVEPKSKATGKDAKE